MSGLEFFFKFNKRVGKFWCCLHVKCLQIGGSRVNFFLEKNKRACLLIREPRVSALMNDNVSIVLCPQKKYNKTLKMFESILQAAGSLIECLYVIDILTLK